MTKRKKNVSGTSGRKSKKRSSKHLPQGLAPALEASLEWSDSHGYDAAVIGGVAVCFHGGVRPTDDLDILILTTDSFASVYESLISSGFSPRYEDTVDFAHVTHALLMRHNDSGVPVDIVLGMLPFEFESMERSVALKLAFGSMKVFGVESLIVMKLVAGRERDLRDVAVLMETYPKFDKRWVMQHIEQHAAMAEQPEVLTRARQILGDS